MCMSIGRAAYCPSLPSTRRRTSSSPGTPMAHRSSTVHHFPLLHSLPAGKMTAPSSSQVMTQLLTLVNVSASAPGKRKLAPVQEADVDSREQRKHKRVQARASSATKQLPSQSLEGVSEVPLATKGTEASTTAKAPPGEHFDAFFSSNGPRAQLLERIAPSEGNPDIKWIARAQHNGAHAAAVFVPDVGPPAEMGAPKALEMPTLISGSHAVKTTHARLESYADVIDCTVTHAHRDGWRDAVARHVMEHAHSTRRRILNNNERLAHAAQNGDDVDPESVRDQGFTRPKVLILAPFRNSALAWQKRLIQHSRCTQVDQKARFEREYSLPEHAVDKLAQPEAKQRYPADHIETFAGNIDDSFTVGFKLTRKSFKLYSPFYDSDFILASPLGLRLSIDKEKSADFLSSIEMLVIDQADVMLMQNWEHVKFVLSKLNRHPKESHDTDFSRVKQWYLDENSRFMRQTVLASSYPCPEVLHLFSKGVMNVAGKMLVTREPSTAIHLVRSGIRQSFHRFDCADPQREAELRFKAFTTKMLPALMRSAVSATKLLVLVPSYFDFLRVESHLRSMKEVAFAALSEYSTPRQITRAREAFFSGRKSILLITERFHFYKRYRIRGCQTIAFYGLPDNAAFYAEILDFPFVRAAGDTGHTDDLEASEVKAEVLFSRFDLLKLQRIVGPEAQKMLAEDKALWKFS